MFNFMRRPPLRRLMLMNVLGGGSWDTITGNPVSFSAKAAPLRQLKVAFSPKQDLHGYDSPWPAGGGKNLVGPSWFSDRPTNYDFNSDGTITVKGTDSSTWAYLTPIPLPAGTYTISYHAEDGSCQFRTSEDNYANNQFCVHNLTNTFTLSADGGIMVKVGLGGNAETWPFPRTVKIQIEKGSTATSWTPYSNLCPISGWSSLHVYDDPLYAGVIEWNQMVDGSNVIASYTSNGVTFTNNNGIITSSNTATGTSSLFLTSTGISQGNYHFTNGHKYLLIGCAQGGAYNTYYQSWSLAGSDYGNGRISTASSDIDGYVYVRLLEGQSGDGLVFKPQVFDLTQMFGAGNEPATVEAFKALFPHDYYPYNAGTETLVGTVNGMDTRSISINIGSTVYSGWVDVVTGVVTVDMASDTFNGSESGWNTYGSDATFWILVDGKKTGWKTSFCNSFKNANYAWASPDYGVYCDYTTDNRCYFRQPNAEVASLADWKTWLSNNPVQLCYELATPLTYQLTPQEVQSLLGENVMFTPCDSLTVTYRSN